jgi:hypothetical protein
MVAENVYQGGFDAIREHLGGGADGVTVETTRRLAEAARALSRRRLSRRRHHRDARWSMPGWCRGASCAAPTRRCTDPRASGDGISLGAGVTMAQIAGQRDLAFLHPVARAVGGPAGAEHGDGRRQPVRAASLWRPRHRAAGAGRARRAWPGQGMPGRSRICCATATGRRWSPRSRCRGRATARLRLPQGQPGEAEGRVGDVDRRALPRDGGRHARRAVAFGAMGPAPLRGLGVERALEGGQALDAATIARGRAVAAEGSTRRPMRWQPPGTGARWRACI